MELPTHQFLHCNKKYPEHLRSVFTQKACYTLTVSAAPIVPPFKRYSKAFFCSSLFPNSDPGFHPSFLLETLLYSLESPLAVDLASVNVGLKNMLDT